MNFRQALISETEHESVNTGKMLGRIPADQFNWRPHEKSMPLLNLSIHIAGLAGWPHLILQSSELDLAAGVLKKPHINSAEDLQRFHQEEAQFSIESLKNATDEELDKIWTLRKGEHVILQMPKGVAIRSMAYNHLYHHRAQLSMYLRLLNIPVPGMYGPSADDMAQAG